MKVSEADARAKIMLSAATSEADWEKIMAQGTQNSWKDEYLVILFSIPLILSFTGEWGRTAVADGFGALSNMPEWYQYLIIGIYVVKFGLRGLLTKLVSGKLGGIKFK
jgi:hypothetical protein